jgi:hypothetical protein
MYNFFKSTKDQIEDYMKSTEATFSITPMKIKDIRIMGPDKEYMSVSPLDDITPIELYHITHLLFHGTATMSMYTVFDYWEYIERNKIQRHFKPTTT